MYQVSGFRCRPELRSSHWMFGSKKWSFLFPRTDVEVLMTSPWKSRCWMCFAFVLPFCICFTLQFSLHHFAMFSIHHLEFTHDWICIRQAQDKNHHGFHHWRRDFSGQLRWVLSTSSPCWEWWWTWSATFWMKLSQGMWGGYSVETCGQSGETDKKISWTHILYPIQSYSVCFNCTWAYYAQVRSVTNSSGVLGITASLHKKDSQAAQDLRTQFSSVRAQGHWLILGWGDKTLLLIDELLLGLAENKEVLQKEVLNSPVRSQTHDPDTCEGPFYVNIMMDAVL